jgi:hypothetical protein
MSDEDDFLAAIANVPDSYLQCRSMMHAWQEDGPGFIVVDSERETTRRARGGQRVFAERHLECLRCGMTRSDAYQITSSHGHTALRKVATTYGPPEGYYVQGAGRLGRELILGAKFERDTADTVVPIRRGKKR